MRDHAVYVLHHRHAVGAGVHHVFHEVTEHLVGRLDEAFHLAGLPVRVAAVAVQDLDEATDLALLGAHLVVQALEGLLQGPDSLFDQLADTP